MKKIYDSQLSSIELMAEDVEGFLSENDIGVNIIFMINLCLDELFTNIITYGYKEEPNNEIELSMQIKDGEVITVVRDSSPEFDPTTQAPEADVSSSLEDRDIGGLGIFFCKKNMDSFEYKRIGDKNELRLIKKI